MKRCDPNAHAKCEFRDSCEPYAEFADNSGCDKFNQRVLTHTMTHADMIRALGDEEMAQKLLDIYRMYAERGEDIATNWCDSRGGCVDENGEELDCTEQMHLACILRWLSSPAEVNNA